MRWPIHTIIFAIIIALTVLHDAHLIAFQPQINLAIAATIYLAVDARWRQTRKKERGKVNDNRIHTKIHTLNRRRIDTS